MCFHYLSFALIYFFVLFYFNVFVCFFFCLVIMLPVVPEWGGQGGAAAPLPFYQEGQGGQYCPLHFSAIATKQMPANFKARLSNAE